MCLGGGRSLSVARGSHAGDRALRELGVGGEEYAGGLVGGGVVGEVGAHAGCGCGEAG